MDNLGLMLGLCAALVFVVTIWRYIRDKKRERAGIMASIGEVPQPQSVLYPQAYWEFYRKKQGIQEKVDDHTWNNLDMDEVYQRVNACWCEAGDILLYQRLRSQASGPETERQEKLVGYLEKDTQALYRIILCLKKIGRGNYHTIKTLTLAPEELDTRWKSLVYALALLPFCSVLGALVSPAFFLVLLVGSLTTNLVATYMLKSKIFSYQAVYLLSNVLHWSKKIAPEIEGCAPDMAAQIRDCLRASKKTNLPFSFMRFSDFCQQMGLPDITGFFLAPLASYFWLVGFVQKQAGTIARLYMLVGEIDLACGVHSYRESLPYWTAPEYSTQRRLTAQGLYHPLLAQPVANSIDTEKCVLLTGSNASGKSTFIKSIALNLVLAQGINTCCARGMGMQRARVVTAMAARESIVDGDSYFLAEIKAMKRLVEAADGGQFSYLFIDEILKGTNTIERIAAACAFLEYLNKDKVLCFAATHDIELVALTTPAYRQYHFAEHFEDGELRFHYRLQEGPSQTRNAIKLLELQNFPKGVTGRAVEAIRRFEQTGIWHTE